MLLISAPFLVSLGLFATSFATDQKILGLKGTNPFNNEFSKLVSETLDFWHVPGVSIAVVDGDDIWAEGYGIATFPDTPVTPATLFSCASTTKAFVAAAMSLLVDDNQNFSQVQWETPIVDIIRDDFVLENDYATTHTTIEDALSHRSGLPRHDFSYGGHVDGHKITTKDAVRMLRHLPLTAEPRTKFQYCNTMYVVVSHVIETLTGRWLGDFLKERLWIPLEMHSTYFSQDDALRAPEHYAHGYVYRDGEFEEVPYMDLDIIGGSGSIISTVLDYTKWLKALLNSSGPMSKAGFTAVKTARTLANNQYRVSPFTGTFFYSLGWWGGVYKGYEFFEHSGGMESFGAQVIFFPELKYGLVALGNTAGTSNNVEVRLTWHLIDEKLGIPEEERFDWNKVNEEESLREIEKYNTAQKTFYPNIPHPKLPLTLPLKNYTGTYFHPGYNNITIFEEDEGLHADRKDPTWKVRYDIEHVSGDNFMVYVDSIYAPDTVFRNAIPATFVIGSNGVSKSFGIGIEPEMGPEKKIWFERV